MTHIADKPRHTWQNPTNIQMTLEVGQKRIIDKHNEGRPVAKIALEFAREALR